MVTETELDRVKKFISDKCIRRAPKGAFFTLSSGATSSYYINIKEAMMNPAILRLLTSMIIEKIDTDETNVIAGVEFGAVPLCSAVAVSMAPTYVDQYNILIKRKKPKKHGTKAAYEGQIENYSQIVVLEDVVTTGATVRTFIKELQDLGHQVRQLITVFDRKEADEDFMGFLSAFDIEYVSLFRPFEFESLYLE